MACLLTPSTSFLLLPLDAPRVKPLKTPLSHLSLCTRCSHCLECLAGLQLFWEANSYSSFKILLRVTAPDCLLWAPNSHLRGHSPSVLYKHSVLTSPTALILNHTCVQYYHQTVRSLRLRMISITLRSPRYRIYSIWHLIVTNKGYEMNIWINTIQYF